jgi:hypothetical protein
MRERWGVSGMTALELLRCSSTGGLFTVADEFPAEPGRPLEVRLMETREALARLQQSIREQCPGDHRYVQHRVGWPPWCEACGFTDIGLHRSEYGRG